MALRKLMGEKNITKTYFRDGDPTRDLHAGICNVKVLNASVYKKYMRAMVKVLNKYVTFRPHPKSLNVSTAPSNETMKEFGFLDINTRIVGAIVAIANETVETPS